MLGEKVVGSPCHLIGAQYAQMIQLHARLLRDAQQLFTIISIFGVLRMNNLVKDHN
jgi:hypothetical protein